MFPILTIFVESKFTNNKLHQIMVQTTQSTRESESRSSKNKIQNKEIDLKLVIFIVTLQFETVE